MGSQERRQRDRERRRATILDAAERVFVRDGVETSTMDAVAAEAEVSKGTLYLYFESKEAMLAAVTERRIAETRDAVADRVARARSGIEAVRGVLETLAERFTVAQCRFALYSMASGAPPPDSPSFKAHEARRREVAELVVSAIERGQQDGTVRADLDARVVAPQLWFGFLGISLINLNRAHLQARFPADVLDRILPTHFDVVLRGLAGPAALCTAMHRRPQLSVDDLSDDSDASDAAEVDP